MKAKVIYRFVVFILHALSLGQNTRDEYIAIIPHKLIWQCSHFSLSFLYAGCKTSDLVYGYTCRGKTRPNERKDRRVREKKKKKQKNKLSEKPKNREEGGRVVSWELREYLVPCY